METGYEPKAAIARSQTFAAAGQLNTRGLADQASPKERAIDSIKAQLRELAGITGENVARISQIAGRLGYNPPEPNEKSANAVPNGHLDEVSDMIGRLHMAQLAAADFIRAIERQV